MCIDLLVSKHGKGYYDIMSLDKTTSEVTNIYNLESLAKLFFCSFLCGIYSVEYSFIVHLLVCPRALCIGIKLKESIQNMHFSTTITSCF